MFGAVVKTIYENFHRGNKYLTNISTVVDDNPSDTLGKVVVDLYDKRDGVPVCSFVMKLNVFESEDKSKTLRKCYIEEFEVLRDIEMEELLFITTMMRNSTNGIMKQQEYVLFSFERELTSAGGYILGMGITDVVYSDDFQTYLRRPNGTLFIVEVQTAENARRTFSIDIKSMRADKFDVTSTFSGNYLKLIGEMAKQTDENKLEPAEKDLLFKLGKMYEDAAEEINKEITKILVRYYTNFVAKYNNKVPMKG